MTEIKFFGTKDPCFFLSNFYKASFTINGLLYRTSEHYYQSKKATDSVVEEKLRILATPRLVANEGRTITCLRSDWEEVKEQIMMEAITAKFTQNNDLKLSLLATKDAILIENSPYDSYWGIGRDEKGKNRLGVLLMELREKFK